MKKEKIMNYSDKEVRVENMIAPVHDKHFYYPPLIKKIKDSRSKEIAKELMGKMLDLGCGTGCFLSQIRKENSNVELYGVDISDGMIKEAKKKLPTDINLAVADVYKLPYPKNTFDLILMAGVFHHIPKKEIALKETKRVLKIGGTIIISDPRKTNSITLKIIHIIFYPLQYLLVVKNKKNILLRANDIKPTDQLEHHGPYNENELKDFEIEYRNPLIGHFVGLLFPDSKIDIIISNFIFRIDNIIGKIIKGYGIKATFTKK